MGDIDDLSQRYQEATRSLSDRFRMSDGENEIRILPRSFEATKWGEPGCKESDPIAFIRHTHFNIPQPDGSKTSKGCPQDEGGYCALHDLSEELKESKIVAEKDLGLAIRASRRFSMNILDMKDIRKGIQVFETGPGVMQEIVKFVNKRFGLLVGVKNGRNIFVTRTPKEKTGTIYPAYSAQPDPNITDITEQLPDGWEEKLDELGKNLRAVPSSQEIMELVKSLRPTFGFPNRPADIGAKKEEEKRGSPPPSEPEEKPKESDSGLKCFGVDFSPRLEKCTSCKDRSACKAKFLES